ncbi:FUSC family protein [Salinispora mooreana]|uniref:FUSC family protein n=1 Tax=Salinispora mooreana TaxID=999545 RepID=UPI000371510B|nr:FUSC family protein [Salinispora mooreana]
MDIDGARLAATVQRLRRRGQANLQDRVSRVRATLVLSVQAGLAAGISWLVAHELLGIPQPVFAPISAVGTLAVSVGQRFRRTMELIIGVAVGVAVGDLLIFLLGTGPWQLCLVVTSAILLTVFAGGSVAILIQAAATAVLIVTLSPAGHSLEIPRFLEALIGGSAALLVTALLLPLNPVQVLNRAAQPALDLLANQIAATAEGLRQRDRDKVQHSLDKLRDHKEEVASFDEAIQGAKETATLSPARWHRRDELTHYAEAADPIERAIRNSTTLTRRSITLVEDAEPIPDPMPTSMVHLAESVRLLRHEFAVGEEPERSRERSLRAVSEAAQAYTEGVGFSGSVVVAQVRTVASDLLVASGITQEEANRLVREAFGDLKQNKRVVQSEEPERESEEPERESEEPERKSEPPPAAG